MNETGKRYRPGQKVPRTGQWQIFRPDGLPAGAERQCDEGEPFPAMPLPGYTFGNPDASKGGNPADPHEDDQDGPGD